jgi:uncharacterized lipoprotein
MNKIIKPLFLFLFVVSLAACSGGNGGESQVEHRPA